MGVHVDVGLGAERLHLEFVKIADGGADPFREPCRTPSLGWLA
jgi:hypothetical protein